MTMDGMKKAFIFYAFNEGKRSVRVIILAALRDDKLLAHLTFIGSSNRQFFEK